MIGMMYILAFGLYLLISIGVVTWAIRYAHKHGKSTKIWGLSAALLMYLLVFWDWIPTVAMHQYYCATEAGFKVYKTVDQWKAENPGVMETLKYNEMTPSTSTGYGNNYIDTYHLNQRFNSVFKKTGPSPVNVWRWEWELVDSKTNEILARSVGFSTGNGKIGGELELRFWLHSDGCIGSSGVNDSRFIQFKHKFLGRR